MRSKSIVLLALALGCGLVASIGISQFMDARNRGADLGDRQPVFVALTDINANDELTAQNIKTEEWPKLIVPAGALTKLEEVEGKRCRMKIYAGEPILSSKLLGADEAVGAAKDIPAGYRVAHVKVDSSSGSNNLILPGDRVDVLVFRNPNAADLRATASKIVLQDIKVFAVDTHTETEFTRTKNDQAEPITAKTISLLVTPRQAEILHAASEISGSVRLVLRNPEDDTRYTSRGATIADIFGPDERSNRKAEQGDHETGDLTNWLDAQQNTQEKAPPEPPTPALPKARGPRGKMIVMYGSELMQVDFPGDGGLPLNPTKKDGFIPGAGPATPLPHGAGSSGGNSSGGDTTGHDHASGDNTSGDNTSGDAPSQSDEPNQSEFIEDPSGQ